ncbi:MAG TPA: polysaccharide deacetylase family protein [Gemmatimonadales bacterium]|nr:polysaccharide deacetylase family protein [Gemmatimonadales bacterium]
MALRKHGNALVLCYHAVSETWPDPVAVTPAQLERQLTFLQRRGFVATTFSDAVAAPAAPRTLAVTFDDGYRSVIDHAFPILERLGIPATVFVPSLYADSPQPSFWRGKNLGRWLDGPFDAELHGLDWEQLRRLIAAGWEVGSHTRSHPHLTKMSPATVEEEIRISRQECERGTEAPCMSLSYPYGDLDLDIVRIASEAGYSYGASLPRRFPRQPSRLEWPRVGLYRPDGWLRFRIKTSPLTLALRSSPAWRVLGPLRRFFD